MANNLVHSRAKHPRNVVRNPQYDAIFEDWVNTPPPPLGTTEQWSQAFADKWQISRHTLKAWIRAYHWIEERDRRAAIIQSIKEGAERKALSVVQDVAQKTFTPLLKQGQVKQHAEDARRALADTIEIGKLQAESEALEKNRELLDTVRAGLMAAAKAKNVTVAQLKDIAVTLNNLIKAEKDLFAEKRGRTENEQSKNYDPPIAAPVVVESAGGRAKATLPGIWKPGDKPPGLSKGQQREILSTVAAHMPQGDPEDAEVYDDYGEESE